MRESGATSKVQLPTLKISVFPAATNKPSMAAERLPTVFLKETQFNSGRNWWNCCPKSRASANFSPRASLEPLDDDKSKFYKELG